MQADSPGLIVACAEMARPPCQTPQNPRAAASQGIKAIDGHLDDMGVLAKQATKMGVLRNNGFANVQGSPWLPFSQTEKEG